MHVALVTNVYSDGATKHAVNGACTGNKIRQHTDAQNRAKNAQRQRPPFARHGSADTHSQNSTFSFKVRHAVPGFLSSPQRNDCRRHIRRAGHDTHNCRDHSVHHLGRVTPIAAVFLAYLAAVRTRALCEVLCNAHIVSTNSVTILVLFCRHVPFLDTPHDRVNRTDGRPLSTPNSCPSHCHTRILHCTARSC